MCKYRTDDGRGCAQSSSADWCRYHRHARMTGRTFRHDRYYHDKIVAGLIEPVWGQFTPAQESAMHDVRAHRDGRASDQYREGVVDDPWRS